jgi:hypothetical protein
VHCSNTCTLGASINRENALALELFKEIGICVDGIMRTAFEAARFLNYFVTKLLAEGREVPEIGETFLYGVFTTMAGAGKASTIEKLSEALNDYEDLRPDVTKVPTAATRSAPTPPTWWRSGGGPTCAGCTIYR